MHDLKFALRVLAKTPGFAVIAALTLALGIGANSAIFSVIDSVLLRPLPFPRPDELVAVWSNVAKEAERETGSFPDYVDLRDQSRSLNSLACYTLASSVLGTGSAAHEIHGVAITSDIFGVLGIAPLLGRTYTPAEEKGQARVVVLTYAAWKRYFNGDPHIIGRDISLSLRPYTVLGVMPPGYQYPVGEPVEYFQPLPPVVPRELTNRGSHFLRFVGRLKHGGSLAQANAEMKAIGSRLERVYPDTNTRRSYYAVSLHEDLVGQVRPALLTVLAAVFVVLLIACANVANLLLARATARRREIAIRTALGASRIRIMRQLLAEGLVLAILGAAGGLLLAWWGIDLLRAFGPRDVPRLDQIAINGTVIAFTLAAALFSTLLFAAFPALQVSKPNVSESLQEGNRGAIGPESHRLRALLVIMQVALSMLLLAGAGLLIKSFGNLRNTNPGFDPLCVVTFDLALPRATYSDEGHQRQFFDQLLPKLNSLPGIQSAGGAMPLPFTGNDRSSSFWIAGRADPGPGNHPNASHLTVWGDYFRAMRVPLLSGRMFDQRDTKNSTLVVMVNDAFVRQFFPESKALGEHILLDHGGDGDKPIVLEIIGVVGSSRHESLAIAPIPEFYVWFGQDPDRRMDVVLRTSATRLAGIDSAVANAVHEIDREIYVPRLQSVSELIAGTLSQPRFNTILLGAFAGVAMALAAIGIYGVIAYSVAQRTKEIGIRMALGAQRRDMLQMILRQSFTIVGIGLAAGVLGALMLTRLIASLLYRVSAHDLSIYGIVLLVLSGAALVATYMPARRAMNVDPMVALRYE